MNYDFIFIDEDENFQKYLIDNSFIIKVPSLYNTVDAGVYVTVHVVLFVIFEFSKLCCRFLCEEQKKSD